MSFHKSLKRLAEIVNLSKTKTLNDIERDSAVKRFEYNFETAWKVMKCYAESQGYTGIMGSRDAIRKAYQMQLIDNPDVWMDMIRWRNETAHNYDGEMADSAIDSVLNSFYPAMVAFCLKMDSLSTLTTDDLFKE